MQRWLQPNYCLPSAAAAWLKDSGRGAKIKKNNIAKLKTRERNLIVVVVVEMPAEKESL